MPIQLLLVDDESDVTELLTRRLQKRGYVCRTAADGKEALASIGQELPNIVIMDVKMPNMDGMETLAHLHQAYPFLPVILLSGHADMETAVSAMAGGAFGYLMKPVDFDELLFKVEDACAQLNLEANV